MWIERTTKLAAACTALILAVSPAARAQYNNDDLRAQIDGLIFTHNLAFPSSLLPFPAAALTAGNTTYGTNLALKYVPPVLRPPAAVAVDPNSADACSYNFTISGDAVKTRQDYLGLITYPEASDMLWEGLGTPQEVYHAHTDVEVSVFAGNNQLSGNVSLPVGTNTLRWRARTLATPLFDYPPWHLIMAGSAAASTKQAAVGTTSSAARQRIARTLSGLFQNIFEEGATAGVDWFLFDGVPTATDGEFVMNNQFQSVMVFDHTAPVFNVTGSTALTVEATQVGGEFLRDHIDTLRAAFIVSDACDRIPNVRFSGPPFLPVGEMTNITWTASDAGPAPGGGVNSTPFVQTVTVQDTLAPILVAPPGRVIESSTTVTREEAQLGNALASDLADASPRVEDDAPPAFVPDTRTLVTWSAIDDSGNSTTANQWITLKQPGTNTAPLAVPHNVAARTFEPIEIELTASDPDFLSGRFDQLNFSITEQPANGFFVAPLFPYFIEDHRVESAFEPPDDGSPAPPDPAQLCFDDRQNYVAPVDFVKDPRYIAVGDDGIAYVSDEFYICSSISGQLESRPRISRFTKNADGELEYDRHVELSGSNPPDSLSIDAHGSIYYVNPASGSSFGTVLGCDPLLTNCAVYDLETGPIGSEIENALVDDPTSIVVDSLNDILYATDGATSLIAYDLQNVDNSNRPAYLGHIADPGELGSSGQNRKDLAIDSQGNLYLSEFGLDRIYKFGASQVDRVEGGTVAFTAGDFVGWLGRCDTNLTETRACDEVAERSYGYSCTSETCGIDVANSIFVTAGSMPGQFDRPQGIAIDVNDVLYVTDHNNFRVQRFTPEGFFAGEAVSECDGSCFVLGDFGNPEDISANLQFFYVLDRERDRLHVFETTPITDFDDDTLQPTQSARVTFQSDDGFTGTDAFSFAVSDGLAQSNEASVSVSVTRNFRAPIPAEGQTFTTEEDTLLEFTVSAFDPDTDDQPLLAYAIEQQPENGTITGLGPDFTYTPNADFFGEDPFTFSVSDGLNSVSAEAHIDVAPVNDAPVITFGEMEDVYGAGFDIKVEVLIDDVDLTDRHVYGLQWGTGAGVISGTALPPGASPANGEPTFVQAADGTAVLVDYETFLGTGIQVITVCVSDTPGVTSLSSCTDPNVTAVATRSLSIQPLVSKQVLIDDDLPTTTQQLSDDVILETTDPAIDGQTFNVQFTVHNIEPEDVATVLDATNVSFTAELGDGLIVGPAAIVGVTGDAVNPSCSSTMQSLSCTIDVIPPNGQAIFELEVVGDGSVVADTQIPIVAMAFSAEQDHNVMVGNAKNYTLTLDPDGDADGDGVRNGLDAFPGDPAESSDVDLDGIGDNADIDDDNDILPDRWETRYGFDPLDPSDATLDNDLDSLTNAEEFALGTRPDTDDSDLDRVTDAGDNCPLLANPNQFDLDADSVGDVCDADHYTAAAALGDIDGNSNSDYALLRTNGGRYAAHFKDGTNNQSVGAVSIDLGAVAERSIVATAGSGANLVTLVRTASGTLIHAIDANTGASVFETPVFDDTWRPVAMIDAGDELWAAAEGSAEVRRVSANDGSISGSVTFDDSLVPVAIARPNAANMVLLGVDGTTGDVIAEIRAIEDGALIESIAIGSPDVIKTAISSLNDGFVVMTQSVGGGGSVSTWSSIGTAGFAFSVFPNDWTVLAIDTLPAWSGTGDAIAVTAISSSGDIQLRVIDITDGAELTRRDFATATDSMRGTAVAASSSGSEVGALIADASNAVSLEIQDAEGANANMRTITAESAQPPSPPPPPPPPPPPAGGGGGGSLSWLFTAALVLLARRRSCICHSESGMFDCRGTAGFVH